MIEKALLKEVVKEVFGEEIQPLYIERQTHHDEHQKVERLGHDDIDFLIAARKFIEALKDTFWKTLMRLIVVAFFVAVTGGLYIYFKHKSNVPH